MYYKWFNLLLLIRGPLVQVQSEELENQRVTKLVIR